MGRRESPPEERFWRFVDKSGGPDACWHWTAAKTHSGYGLFTFRQKNIRAHRFAYELTYGPIPPGLNGCHKCDCRDCVNPTHIFLGTQLENMQDAASKGRTSGFHRTRISPQTIAQIKRLLADGISQTKIAGIFGLSQSTISSIKLGEGVYGKEVTPTNTQQATKSAAAPTTELATLP